MQLQESQRRETERLARASTSKANGSHGQSTAPSKLPLGPITASATASAPGLPTIAKPTPVPSAPSSWPSFPAVAHSNRATSLPSMPAASDHATNPSNALLPASGPRYNSQPADSTNESLQPFQPAQPSQPLQPQVQSTNLIRFRIDAPNSQGNGSNKRQKLE